MAQPDPMPADQTGGRSWAEAEEAAEATYKCSKCGYEHGGAITCSEAAAMRRGENR